MKIEGMNKSCQGDNDHRGEGGDIREINQIYMVPKKNISIHFLEGVYLRKLFYL